MKDLADLTSRCIRCGFCLESCPTFVVTGKETESPRGRIYLARSADEGKVTWASAKPHFDACLGCRACETACPSGVEYGQIFEEARDRLEGERPSRTKAFLLDGLTSPPKLNLQLALSKMLPGRTIPAPLSRLLSGEAPQAEKPRPQADSTWPVMDEDECLDLKGKVFLLEGCVMRVLFPRVHEATRRLLLRLGFSIHKETGGCCGALHAHSGYLKEAHQRASETTKAFAGDDPIIVNSAGCGSMMKEYGEHVPQGEQTAKRVFDASEFLFQNGLVDLLKKSKGVAARVTYHDACHLAHGQGVRLPPRDLLAAIPGIELVPLPEADMCCGSAGIYNLTQPTMARNLLERKWANVERTEADILVMGNPGCHAWLAQAAREHGGKVRVLHTMEILEAAFSGLDGLR